MKIWVVVASAARARMFEINGKSQPLTELFDLVNPQERLRRQDLKSDKPGRAFDKSGGQRHSVQTPVDPKEQEAIGFAREVVERLAAEHYKQSYERLYLIAPPHFLGLLRERMSDSLTRDVAGELAKDLTRESAASVQEHILPLL